MMFRVTCIIRWGANFRAGPKVDPYNFGLGPQIHPTLFEKTPTKAHYGELSKFRHFVGRNKAPLWMTK